MYIKLFNIDHFQFLISKNYTVLKIFVPIDLCFPSAEVCP